MSKKLTQQKIMTVVDWSYNKAVNGVPGFSSAPELAEEYMRGNTSLDAQVKSLIRWQNTKAGTSGFISGIGGLALLPASLPANITSVMYVQVKMIAAIAYMGGYDLSDDRVKSLIYTCLCGNAAKDIAKDIGVKIGAQLTEQAITRISQEVIVKINQAVGFKLLTKFGQTGVINLGKAIPLAGGLIGATFDSVTTNVVGNIAHRLFITKV